MVKYGINTNCLRRKLTRTEIVELARSTGASGIEWGLDGLENAARDAREMTHLTLEAGLEVIGFINSDHLWKTDRIRCWSEAIAGNTAITLRVDPPWYAWDFQEALHQRESFLEQLKIAREGLEKLQAVGREFNIRYVIESHPGTPAASPYGIKMLMDGLDPATVGAIWDPANMILEGQLRPGAAVELLGKYLAYVHVKNLEWRSKSVNPGEKPGWEFQRRAIDQGMVDYEEVAFALKCLRYSGWLSFEELISNQEGIAAELKNGMAYLEQCFATVPDRPVEPYTSFNA